MGGLESIRRFRRFEFSNHAHPDGLELYVTRIVDMGDESTDERMVRKYR